MNAPVVSVVMANYNGARHLAEAIRSALGQTLGALEVILADDASSDDSLAVAQAAADSDPRLILSPATTNAGPATARNRAFDIARGRWIAILDSDDLMAPDRLQRLTAVGERWDADIVVDDIAPFADGQAAESGQPFLGEFEPRWITSAGYIEAARMYARAPNLGYLKPLFRRSTLAALRYREDLRIGEDYDLVLRLLLRGARMRLTPEVGYRYRRHDASISARLNPSHLHGMLAADADLTLPDDPAVRRAQARRTRSLEQALAYEQVVAALKARDLAAGIGQSLVRPDIWPLLTLPVKARMRRLAARLQPA